MTNETRRNRALSALDHYTELDPGPRYADEDEETRAKDLIIDLLHIIHSWNPKNDFQFTLGLILMNFEEELAEEEDPIEEDLEESDPPIHNPACEGEHCQFPVGQVRLLPLNCNHKKLCRSCFNHALKESADSIAANTLWESCELITTVKSND